MTLEINLSEDLLTMDFVKLKEQIIEDIFEAKSSFCSRSHD